ncbi:MAG: hypothetical protein JST90_03805 [Bacteroidetes bacterium]|nr:hypothetical protein [Bacteroidota bacterium]
MKEIILGIIVAVFPWVGLSVNFRIGDGHNPFKLSKLGWIICFIYALLLIYSVRDQYISTKENEQYKVAIKVQNDSIVHLEEKLQHTQDTIRTLIATTNLNLQDYGLSINRALEVIKLEKPPIIINQVTHEHPLVEITKPLAMKKDDEGYKINFAYASVNQYAAKAFRVYMTLIVYDSNSHEWGLLESHVTDNPSTHVYYTIDNATNGALAGMRISEFFPKTRMYLLLEFSFENMQGERQPIVRRIFSVAENFVNKELIEVTPDVIPYIVPFYHTK